MKKLILIALVLVSVNTNHVVQSSPKKIALTYLQCTSGYYPTDRVSKDILPKYASTLSPKRMVELLPLDKFVFKRVKGTSKQCKMINETVVTRKMEQRLAVLQRKGLI